MKNLSKQTSSCIKNSLEFFIIGMQMSSKPDSCILSLFVFMIYINALESALLLYLVPL